MKENRINMSTAFDKFNIKGVAEIKIEDIKEFTNKEGKDFCILKVCKEGNIYDIACTDLIYKQLRGLPFLWSEVKNIYIISLKSESTGFRYFMISKIKQRDDTIIQLTDNTSYSNVIEHLNNTVEGLNYYEEGDVIEYDINNVIEKNVIRDGSSQTLFTLQITDNICLKLTRQMNRELNRIKEQRNMSLMTGIGFKCIDGIWKIAKIIFKK